MDFIILASYRKISQYQHIKLSTEEYRKKPINYKKIFNTVFQQYFRFHFNNQ